MWVPRHRNFRIRRIRLSIRLVRRPDFPAGKCAAARFSRGALSLRTHRIPALRSAFRPLCPVRFQEAPATTPLCSSIGTCPLGGKFSSTWDFVSASDEFPAGLFSWEIPRRDDPRTRHVWLHGDGPAGNYWGDPTETQLPLFRVNR